MDADTLKKKVQKQNPLMMSPMAFALAACGGGGSGENGDSPATDNNASNDQKYLYQVSSREMESNNSLSTANYMTQTTVTGQSYSSDDDDYYYVNLPDWSVFNVNFSSDHFGDHQVSILDEKGILLSSVEIAKEGVVTASPYHPGGVYVLVESDIYDDEDYTINITQGSGNYEREPNNRVVDADEIYTGMMLTAQSFSAQDVDYYVFTAVSTTSTVSFQSNHFGDHNITIYDSSGNVMTSKEISKSDQLETATFIGSKYYVSVESDIYDDDPYSLTLLNSEESALPLVNFMEQDSPDTPEDYDWAVLDREAGKFALHIEDFSPYDAVFNNILAGKGDVKFVIAYGDTSTEDASYISKGYSGYNWVDADSAQASNSGIQKQIIITDEAIKNTVLNNGYDYISFGVATVESAGLGLGFSLFEPSISWALDDFAISEGVIA